MAFIEFDDLNSRRYQDFRFDLMTDLWGDSFKPYVDHDGIARIGPGIALSSYLEEVTRAITGVYYDDDLLAQLAVKVAMPYDSGDTALLRQRLNTIMADWASSNELPSRFGRFQFANDAQSREALDASMRYVESALDGWGDIGVVRSEERAVIASLFQEGIDSTLQDDIMNDLFNGDRQAVWFDIRYMNSGFEGSVPSAGKEIAARRYRQSEVFELYNDPGDVDRDEAEDVGMAYTANRASILPYEKRYDADDLLPGGKALGGSHGIVGHLQPAIKAIADVYDLDIGRMEELLYVTQRSGTFFGDRPGQDFNSRKNDDDLILGTLERDTINGGVGDDVIAGRAGDDRLIGGKGNDGLYGGEGRDRLEGGDGNDLLDGGGGRDRLDGGRGNDRYILGRNDELDPDDDGTSTLKGSDNDDAIVEAKNGGIDTVILEVRSGNFDFRNVEVFRMAGNAGGTYTVKLNDIDRFQLSGGNDDLTLVINRLQKQPIMIETGGGRDDIHIRFANGVDPSQVLDGKGLTARFRFDDLSANDTIDLTSIGIREIITGRDSVDVDTGYYLLAPGAKLDLMDGKQVEKTYNNYTDNWFVVKLGDNTPYGPEFIGDIDKSHFDI